MSKKIKVLKLAFLILLAGWSLILAFFATSSVYKNYSYAKDLALNEAIVSTKKDLAYRSWVSSHGGVYVPIDERTQPNQYLLHIKNRDVNTTSGQYLTLMNPAYTLSQMMRDYSELYGTKGHLTSRKFLNPKNIPDVWENTALKKIEKTKESFYEKVDIGGKPHMRYIKPLLTTKDCLKCHAFQGYKVGDVRGGVSVAIPLESFNEEAYTNSIPVVLYFILLWIVGCIAIAFGYKKAHKIIEEKIKNYEQNLFGLVDIIEKRDRYTAGHTQRVAHYSVLIAKELGISETETELLSRACMLHDIGKISIPDSILLKPERLTSLEYDIIKEHVSTGFGLLKKIDIYVEVAQIMRHHHEHYDGSGYPEGLKGDEIPFLSQIMTVADSFDAMTTNRVYKKQQSVEDALREIEELAGKQFHPQIAKVAQSALGEIKIEQGESQSPKNKLEEERFAYFYKDQVTDAYNKNYLTLMLKQEVEYRYVYGIFLHNFTQFNHLYGWKKGDELLKKTVQEIQKVFPDGVVFRLFGDDYLVMCKNGSVKKDRISSVEESLVQHEITVEFKKLDLHVTPMENADFIEEAFKRL